MSAEIPVRGHTDEAARDALLESEQCFKGAFEHAAIGMAFARPDGGFAKVNRSMCAMLGYSEEELLAMSFKDVTHPSDVEASVGHLGRLLAGELDNYQFEKRYLHKNGEVVWVTLSVTPVRDPAGAPLYMVGQIQDITATKKAAEKLAKAEAQYRTMVEHVPSITYVDELDDKATSIYISPQVERLLGYTPAEIMADPDLWLSRIHPDDYDRVIAETARHNAGTEPLRIEYRMLTRDDRIVWFRDEAFMVTDENGTPLVSQGVILDITGRKGLEKQLVESQKMEAVGRLAGGIAHDFNNILSVMQNYARLLADDLDASDPRREDVMEIVKAGDRGANLIRQLMTFSRKEEVKKDRLDLNDVVEGMDQLLHKMVGSNVEVALELSTEPCGVLADAGQLEQALANLAVNARDAMPDGGRLTISTSATEVPGEGNGRVSCLKVSDTGHGMTEEQRAHIFEPFFTTKPRGKGTGLGLAIVHGVVERAGGHVFVDSSPGRGTTFELRLPASAQPPTPETRTPSGPVATADRTVMVVDDETSLREIVVRILSRNGYLPLQAGPTEAKEIIADRSRTIDVLLTDVIMPEVSGEELAGMTRSLRPDCTILFMSGYARDVVSGRNAIHGDEAFIQKPFTQAQLLSKLEAALESGPDQVVDSRAVS